MTYVIYPKTAAEVEVWLPNRTPQSIWDCQDASGALTDELGVQDLAAVGTPSYELGGADARNAVGFNKITFSSFDAALPADYAVDASTSQAFAGKFKLTGDDPRYILGILNHTDTPANYKGWELGVNSGSKGLIVRISDGTAATTPYYIYVGGNFADGNWHTFLLTFDRNSGVCTLRTDLGSGSVTMPTADLTPSTGVLALGSGRLTSAAASTTYLINWQGSNAEGFTDAEFATVADMLNDEATVDLRNHGKTSLPKVLVDDDRFDEVVDTMLDMVNTARRHTDNIQRNSFIQTAQDSGPDWVDMHARNRGTMRQDGESTDDLRARIRYRQPQVSNVAIEAAIAEIVSGATVFDLEGHAASLAEITGESGTGATFVKDGSNIKFTPDSWSGHPWVLDVLRRRGPWVSSKIVISGAVDAGNDGTFDIASFDDDAIVWANASGASRVDAGVSWELQMIDPDGQNTSGWKSSYIGRGYRLGAGPKLYSDNVKRIPGALIVILPYAATASQEAAVRERLRQSMAAGVLLILERRTTP